MSLRVTLADVAKEAGVGKSTVARVLQNSPRVSEETRQRVQAAVLKLGYVPDPALRVLAAHRWGRTPSNDGSTVALVVHRARGRHDVSAPYVACVKQRAQELGYKVELFELGEFGSARRLSDVLHARGIKAVLVTPIISDEFPLDFEWRYFAMVGCGVGEFRLPIHCVDMNYFSITRTAWRECRRLGYTRIGAALFHQPGPDYNDAQRHAASLYEQSLLPASAKRIPILGGPMDDRSAFLAWVKKHRPDAVIAISARYYWNLLDAGYRIPQDVGFCALRRSLESNVTAVECNYRRISVAAINWVDRLLHQNELGLPEVPDEILIEPELYAGKTLRDLRQKRLAGAGIPEG